MSTETTQITRQSLAGNKELHGMEGDPFVGEQETTDSPLEAMATPDYEMVLERPPVGPAVKSRTIAGVLGVFLGGLGLHRFYLGYTRMGGWQLALTTGCFVIALAAALLTGSTVTGALGVAFGAAALGMAWGFLEGLAIAVGGLSHDAAGRPLRA
ncbi:MAG: TM2 domain-containing protein [Pyrinomonadaceae bacterium]|nr:TM2 domain-containing protein [Phycisphaerales bacterium]